MRLSLAVMAIAVVTTAQTPPATRILTLAEARATALRNHPRIDAANLLAEAAKSGITGARAPLFPQVSGAFTSVAAEHNSTLSAGTIQTSSLYSRVAAGIAVSQLVADFGRTNNLSEAAKLRASAQRQLAGNTRAETVIEVDQAYYQALAAIGVLKVARAVLANRRLVLRQISALAQNALNSTLDVSFAQVAVSDAELSLVHAENDVEASRARLTAALGATSIDNYELADEPLPAAPDAHPDGLIAEALKQRPDLAARQLSRDSAYRSAQAEKDLSRPTISVLAVAGDLPAADPRLHETYSAAGLNVNVPVFNGHAFAARRTEAELRARAADKDVDDLKVQITEQVRTAWLEVNTAFRRLDVMTRLVAQTAESLRLAQTRYDNALGSIVELNQAQLSEVSAQIEAARAKYEYLSRRSALSFVMGEIR
jgi:outer membrane protein